MFSHHPRLPLSGEFSRSLPLLPGREEEGLRRGVVKKLPRERRAGSLHVERGVWRAGQVVSGRLVVIHDARHGFHARPERSRGQRVHRRRIVDVRWIENAGVALGRSPTQEELEFLGDGEVILFEIGEVVL